MPLALVVVVVEPMLATPGEAEPLPQAARSPATAASATRPRRNAACWFERFASVSVLQPSLHDSKDFVGRQGFGADTSAIASSSRDSAAGGEEH